MSRMPCQLPSLIAKARQTLFDNVQAGLVPGSYVGMGNNGTGCFTRGTGISMGVH